MQSDVGSSEVMGNLLVFYRSRDKQCSPLKPGQKMLQRAYYDKSTRNMPDGNGYAENYTRFNSTYAERHNKNVQPKDYKEKTVAKNLLSIYQFIIK